MADVRFPSSGDVVATRYELMEQVSERLGATTWRARDRVLERRSTTTTSWPDRRNHQAVEIPIIPLPRTATFIRAELPRTP